MTAESREGENMASTCLNNRGRLGHTLASMCFPAAIACGPIPGGSPDGEASEEPGLIGKIGQALQSAYVDFDDTDAIHSWIDLFRSNTPAFGVLITPYLAGDPNVGKSGGSCGVTFISKHY